MNDPPRQLPSSSNAMTCISAMPTPSASPPWTCPSTIIGLIRTPQSSTAMNRRTCTCAGARVHVDDADVGAERVGEVRRVVHGLRVEVALDAVGQLERAVRGHRDLRDAAALLRVAAHLPAAVRPLQVVRATPRASPTRRSWPARGPCAPRPRRPRRRPGSTGSRRCRARTGSGRCRRARTSTSSGGMPELLGDDLRERRLVPLALGLAGDAEHRLAGRVHPQVGAVGHAEPEDVHVLARAGADALGEEATADAHQLAARPLLRLLAAQLRRSRRSPSRPAASAGSCPSRTSQPVGRRVRELLGRDEGSSSAARPGPRPARARAASTIRSTRYTASVIRNEQR